MAARTTVLVPMGKEYVSSSISISLLASPSLLLASSSAKARLPSNVCVLLVKLFRPKALQPRPQQISTCELVSNSNEFGCQDRHIINVLAKDIFSRYNTCQPQDNFSIQLGSGRELVCNCAVPASSTARAQWQVQLQIPLVAAVGSWVFFSDFVRCCCCNQFVHPV